AEPSRHAGELALERLVLERLHLATVAADEMVVVLAVRPRGLVARHPVADVHARHQRLAGEDVEDAVDARDADPLPRRAQALVQLLRGDAALEAVEAADDGAAGAAAVPGGPQRSERVLRPPRRLPRHTENDTRSHEPARLQLRAGENRSRLRLRGRRRRRGRLRAARAGGRARADEGGRRLLPARLRGAGDRRRGRDGREPDAARRRAARRRALAARGRRRDPRGPRALPRRRLPAGCRARRRPPARALARPRPSGGRGAARPDGGSARLARPRALRADGASGRRCAGPARPGGRLRRTGARARPRLPPRPRAVRRLVEAVRRARATTVLTETLASPRLARTVAREAGVRTAVLDPLEGLTVERQARGTTYFTVMRANLRVLRRALGCR